MVLLTKNHYQFFVENTCWKKSHIIVSCSRWQLYSCKFSNQKSPRWVYVNFNWLSRFIEIAYTERNNRLGWCKLNISKQLKKRWHSIWKYGSPATNRTSRSCLCNPMWKYGWFPLHLLLRIFLAISFVNLEPHKSNFHTENWHSDRISAELITGKLTWKESLWNVKFGLFRIRFFRRLSALQVHPNVLVNFCPYKTRKKAKGENCTETMDD